MKKTCITRCPSFMVYCLLALVAGGCGNSSERDQLPEMQAAITDGQSAPEGAESEQAEHEVESEPEPTPIRVDLGNVSCTSPSAEFQQAILNATNEARANARQCGTTAMTSVPALIWNDTLSSAAHLHSVDMADNNFFSHTGSDGLVAGDRITSLGYRYRAHGENIAAGYETVQQTQSGWLNSPGHCENIMSPLFTQMGAACVQDADTDFRYYWTVVFGTELN